MPILAAIARNTSETASLKQPKTDPSFVWGTPQNRLVSNRKERMHRGSGSEGRRSLAD